MLRALLCWVLCLVVRTAAAVDGSAFVVDGKLSWQSASVVANVTTESLTFHSVITHRGEPIANGPAVTVDGAADLGAAFAPWFVDYVRATDRLLRAVAQPVAAGPLDADRGAQLRAEAMRLDVIERAAHDLQRLHDRVRIDE